MYLENAQNKEFFLYFELGNFKFEKLKKNLFISPESRNPPGNNSKPTFFY